MSGHERKNDLITRMTSVRERTLWLLDQVSDEFLRQRVHAFYSPIGWHFGHVGRTEEYWIMCAALQQAPCDEKLDFLYTDRADNPKDNRVNIPDRADTLRYLAKTRARVMEALESANMDSEDPFIQDGYAWDFAIQHECQHQETICEMLHLIQKESPQAKSEPAVIDPNVDFEWVELAGGSFEMGTNLATTYDNEKTAHNVSVPGFKLAKTPVTVRQWVAFMTDNGYQRQELWTEPGWAWREAEGAVAPEYWVGEGKTWLTFGPWGVRPPDPDEPVCGISHHEAEAFAAWAKKRLPTEEEWEFAARAGEFPWGEDSPTDRHARFGMAGWAPAKVQTHKLGETGEGVQDLAGNVWEWTSSSFLPYPGFVAFPYDGYSKDHMLGAHRVCRGGSWATAAPILRRTFRNWYVPTYRQGFLGMRLAD